MLDREGVAGPEDIAVVGDETSVTRQLERFADTGVTELAARRSARPPEQDRTMALLAQLTPVTSARAGAPYRPATEWRSTNSSHCTDTSPTTAGPRTWTCFSLPTLCTTSAPTDSAPLRDSPPSSGSMNRGPEHSPSDTMSATSSSING